MQLFYYKVKNYFISFYNDSIRDKNPWTAVKFLGNFKKMLTNSVLEPELIKKEVIKKMLQDPLEVYTKIKPELEKPLIRYPFVEPNKIPYRCHEKISKDKVMVFNNSNVLEKSIADILEKDQKHMNKTLTHDKSNSKGYLFAKPNTLDPRPKARITIDSVFDCDMVKPNKKELDVENLQKANVPLEMIEELDGNRDLRLNVPSFNKTNQNEEFTLATIKSEGFISYKNLK